MDARGRKLASCCFALAAFTTGCSQTKPELTVFVAASAREAVESLANGHHGIRLNAAATSALAKQILHGAPADILVSADAAWVLELQEADRVRQQAVVATNRLVLVVPKGSTASSLKEAIAQAEFIAAADPRHVPAGRYTQASLQAMGLWEPVRDRLTSSANVRAALALVENKSATVGIVYQTDAQHADVDIVGELPSPEAPVVVAVRLKSESKLADDFYQHLTGAEGRRAFTSLGFGTP